MKIAVFVGSLRADSLNKKLARTLEQLAPDGTEFTYVDIRLPLFNQELEAEFPKEAQAVKEIVRTADGVLFVTPEYNRSVPGVLKNAIDWASRPYGDSAFNGKPVALAGMSGSSVGTALAQADLRNITAFLNMKMMGQPEVYVANAAELTFDENGILQDERWRKNLQAFMEAFVAHVEKG